MIKWTDSQLRAINDEGKNILVSASAGSGKTGVLVERIVSRIVSGELSADRMLVVTFTKAAASEMREKIINSLKKRIAERPSDKRLRKQTSMMQSANISTVHAFCLEIIKNHYFELDIPAEFSQGSQAEMDEIKSHVYDEIIAEKYAKASGGGDFEKLVFALSGPRDDLRFKDIVLKLYDFSRNNANPNLWLNSLVEMYKGDTEEFRKWIRENVIDICFEEVSEALTTAKRYAEKFAENEITAKNYALTASEDAQTLSILKDTLLEGDWEKIVKAYRETGFENLRSMRLKKGESLDIYESDLIESFKKEIRKEYKDMVASHAQSFFPASLKEVCSDLEEYESTVTELISIIQEFSRRFEAEKLRRQMLDFSDLEHYALRLLINQNGEPSEIAVSMSQGFDEILVDEYQDTNGVQDLIFQVLSSGRNNLFMVGDVKQSIYRFRSANPEIFLDRFESYKSGSTSGESIMLSENFRSRKEVIDGVNFLMGNIFSKKLGQINYCEHSLKPAAFFPESKWDHKTEFVFIDMKQKEAFEEQDEESGENVCASSERFCAEGRYIANCIKKYIENDFEVYDAKLGGHRRAEYSDFAVLLRSQKNTVSYYKAALENAGIPVDVSSPANFFERYEMLLLTSLLRVLDNPRQEIALAAVMNSPLFGFVPDDLIKIRSQNPSAQFYEAVFTMAEKGDEKCSSFLSELNKFREMAKDVSAYELIFNICSMKNIFGIVGRLPDGKKRQDNIWTLLEAARKFESGRFRSISEFIEYIDAIKTRKDDVRDIFENPISGGVKLMSVHGSKGLEFPVVFLAGVSRQFNDSDEKNSICMSDKFGIGFKAKNYDRFLEYPLITYSAIKTANKREKMSEEARTLYVALTRAREKLFIVSSTNNLERSVTKVYYNHLQNPFSPRRMLKARSYGEWIIATLVFSQAGRPLLEYAQKGLTEPIIKSPDDIAVVITDGFFKATESKPKLTERRDENICSREDIKTVIEHLKYRYPFDGATKIPTKITPSQLKHEPEKNKTAALDNPKKKLSDTALFKKSPVLAGIAAHRVMQYIDFSKCAGVGEIADEISRLVSDGFISKDDYNLVDPNKISRFFNTDFARRMLLSENILREFKFSLLFDSEEFYPDVRNEKILMQGVIDCAFETADGFVIIDFKTDRVRGDTQALSKMYKPQLDMYSKALTELTKKKVLSRYIYFFDADILVAV